MSKVKSMLLHNYAKVRVAAAETFFVLTESTLVKEELKQHDWTKSRTELKLIVHKF
jgi:hypothetical protein